MEWTLNDVEIRVLGSLVEKELTTPDYYPLTLNSLTLACNQKSNRSPVVSFDEPTVVRGLDRLRHLGLAMQAASEGSRVPKYRHTLEEKLFLEQPELAILCELLIRGPQTVGELRTRCERMYPFADLQQVESVLTSLMERETPLAVQLPRQPGQKECRFQQLLGGEPDLDALAAAVPPSEAATMQVRAQDDRFEKMEMELAEVKEQLAALQAQFAQFKAQFE